MGLGLGSGSGYVVAHQRVRLEPLALARLAHGVEQRAQHGRRRLDRRRAAAAAAAVLAVVVAVVSVAAVAVAAEGEGDGLQEECVPVRRAREGRSVLHAQRLQRGQR